MELRGGSGVERREWSIEGGVELRGGSGVERGEWS